MVFCLHMGAVLNAEGERFAKLFRRRNLLWPGILMHEAHYGGRVRFCLEVHPADKPFKMSATNTETGARLERSFVSDDFGQGGSNLRDILRSLANDVGAAAA